jgi:hypothetical protein
LIVLAGMAETIKNKKSLISQMGTVCPFCKRKQTQEPLKSWSYGKILVNRYLCQCKKIFNHYQSDKSSWTIPKKKS